VHLPYLGLAVLLVALGAIGFGALASGSTPAGTVLAASHDVAPGQVLSAGDLVAVHVSAGSSVQLVPASQESSIVGKRAAVALPAGALLSPQSVRSGAALQPGQAIVSVVLAPGTAPVPDLRAGDQVAVVATAAAGDTGGRGVLADAQVVRVDGLRSGPTTSGSLTVSLEVPSSAAASIAAAAAGDHVRLALVAPGDNLTSSSSGH
jgi:Flp pilus assembly protein CpaB